METQAPYHTNSNIEENPLMLEIKKSVGSMEIEVKNDLHLEVAKDFVKQLANYEDRVKNYWKGDIEKANALHKSLTSKRKVMLDYILDAKSAINKKISEYWNKKEEERRRKEEQERIAAREREEKQRAKLEAEAKAAEEKGKTERAESLKQRAEEVYVPPKPVAQPELPKGMQMRKTYEVVIEKKEDVPEIYKTVDIQALKRAQVAMRGQLKVPGVRFVEKLIPVTRR